MKSKTAGPVDRIRSAGQWTGFDERLKTAAQAKKRRLEAVRAKERAPQAEKPSATDKRN